MAFALPAMEARGAEDGDAAAIDVIVRADAGPEARQRRDHLEGRARRILAGHRLVVERAVDVVAQLLPLVGGEAAIERRRVVGRRRDQREQVAGIDVHHRRRARHLARQALVRELVQADVERGDEIAAGLAFLARQLADHAAEGIDLELAFAGAAAQRQSRTAAPARSCRCGSRAASAADRDRARRPSRSGPRHSRGCAR